MVAASGQNGSYGVGSEVGNCMAGNEDLTRAGDFLNVLHLGLGGDDYLRLGGVCVWLLE